MASSGCDNCRKTERELARAFARLDALVDAMTKLDLKRGWVVEAENDLAAEVQLTVAYVEASKR